MNTGNTLKTTINTIGGKTMKVGGKTMKANSNKKRLSVSFICVLTVLAIIGAPAAMAEVKLRMLSTWAAGTNDGIDLGAIPFAERVEELSGGEVTVEFFGPAAVPAFRQFDAIEHRVFDMLFTHTAYHADSVKVGMGLDLAAGSAQVRRECGLTKAVNDAYLAQSNLSYLAQFPSGYGYRLYLAKAMNEEGGPLAGFRIRGTEFYNPIIHGMNASSVRVSSAEAYTAAQRGLLDGAFNGSGALATLEKMSWNEVMSYAVEPDLGEVVYALFVNKDSWAELDEDVQKIIRQAIEETQVEHREAGAERDRQGMEKFPDAGLEIVELKGADRKAFESFYYDGIAQNYVLDADPEHGPKIMKALKCVRDRSEG
ncbi:TRAP transporter substrate-binding protein DctP [Marinobacter sp. TBZ242]|uniref:TRAP transporter substrate-binding protein DctP n=1 Tax=Marinobacter azerbaijanicus TaxID=3050455 RepID=A0ABT7IHJ8_9GAMM|nr:TRAP transporter substrate-binding protein DctP [Marinobacter sp. TBZ242]MDL0433227.1 TRAP transporter substrate-binding protein DctP [Marinobacter sp. TBZ242]